MHQSQAFIYYPFLQTPFWFQTVQTPITNHSSFQKGLTFQEQEKQKSAFFKKKNQVKVENKPQFLSKQIFSERKMKKQRKLSQGQRQYKPYDRKYRKKVVVLKQNRNVLPIKMRQIFSFLCRENKSGQLTQKIFKKSNYNSQFSQKRFYAYVNMKKNEIGNYVKLQVFKFLFRIKTQQQCGYTQQEQIFYHKIIRIIFKHYLDHISTLCTLTSNRIHSCKKIEHLKVQRFLIHYIRFGSFQVMQK